MPMQHILDDRMDTTMKRMILLMNLNRIRAKCIGNTRYMQCPCNIFIYYEQVAVTLPEDGRPRNSTQRGLNMASTWLEMASIWIEDSFEMAQDGSRLLQDGFKMASTWHRNYVLRRVNATICVCVYICVLSTYSATI